MLIFPLHLIYMQYAMQYLLPKQHQLLLILKPNLVFYIKICSCIQQEFECFNLIVFACNEHSCISFLNPSLNNHQNAELNLVLYIKICSCIDPKCQDFYEASFTCNMQCS